MKSTIIDASSRSQECQPPIRWAGGKRLHTSRLTRFLPKTFLTYHEPMLGSGALFFSLAPDRASLSDINPELVNFYRVFKSRPRTLYLGISRLHASHHTYYRLRASRPSSQFERAVRFFYLIRLAWNGLYRVNRAGLFNVPFSGRTPRDLVSLDRLLRCSEALRNATLSTADFATATRTASAGDLVYLDPPYPRGASMDNGFARYSRRVFDLDAHQRLANHAADLARRGVHVLVTQALRRELLSLYPLTFRTTVIRTPSLIAATPADRRDAYEAILTSYPCPGHTRPERRATSR